MRTSKIEKIVGVKPWGEGERKVLYHSLEMSNGDKIQIGKKKELAIGEELNYEIIDTNQEYNKAKSVNPNFNGGGGNSKETQFKSDPEKNASIQLQVCLKQANYYHAQHGFRPENGEPLEELVQTTKYLYEKIFNS